MIFICRYGKALTAKDAKKARQERKEENTFALLASSSSMRPPAVNALLSCKLADEHFKLQARRGLRGLDGEIGEGNALDAAREGGGICAASSGQEFFALAVG